jgi:hypothetical protein
MGATPYQRHRDAIATRRLRAEHGGRRRGARRSGIGVCKLINCNNLHRYLPTRAGQELTFTANSKALGSSWSMP